MLLLGLFYNKQFSCIGKPICFITDLSIYLPFTSFYLREEKEAKVLGVTGDEDIADTENKQTNKYIHF